jgi:hypothetical protein
MAVDQARQHGATREVELDGPLGRRHGAVRPDFHDPLAIDQHGRVGHDRRPGAVEQAPGPNPRHRHRVCAPTASGVRRLTCAVPPFITIDRCAASSLRVAVHHQNVGELAASSASGPPSQAPLAVFVPPTIAHRDWAASPVVDFGGCGRARRRRASLPIAILTPPRTRPSVRAASSYISFAFCIAQGVPWVRAEAQDAQVGT